MPALVRKRPLALLSVRTRILTAVLVTTALGMLGAGGVSYLIAREQTLDNIRSSLLQENEEINTVATLAGRGETGSSGCRARRSRVRSRWRTTPS